MKRALALACAVAACHAPRPAHESLDDAYRKKDWAAMLRIAEADVAARPTSPRALVAWARASALMHDAGKTAAAIDRLASLSVVVELAKHPDLAAVRDSHEVAAAVARMQAAGARLVGTASVAFTLDDAQLLTEGIARDPASGDFFVSSVHRRKIVRVGEGGGARDFVTSGQDGICGVLGLTVDVPRKLLWATSSCVPEVEGLRADERGRTGVFAFDLASGELRERVVLEPSSQPHHFDDLALDGEGRVLVADAAAGIVWVLEQGAPLEPWLGGLASPQGLALSPDGRTLWLADYSRGLARVDRATRAVTWLRAGDAVLAGLDGLVLDPKDASLIATQNGISPPRVLRITIEADRARVTTLLMNAPEATEPTLGVLAGDAFVFVANAQWDSFAPTQPASARVPPVILRLPLH